MAEVNENDNQLSCTRRFTNIFNYLMRCRTSPEEQSREIVRPLERDKHTLRQVKILLLGAGDSGKSTFLKQIRIINGVQFEPELMLQYELIIYQNIVKGMQVLVDAREKLETVWEKSESETAAEKAKMFLHKSDLHAHRFQKYAATIQILWQDRAIRTAYNRRREYQIRDSVSYFFEEIERIAKPIYVPNQKDILLCTNPTKVVHELTIMIKDIPFVFVDVGGQRTQRQNWMTGFKSATSILFLVAASEFDQVLVEDRKTNRLDESKSIFGTIVNNTTLKEIPITLFINKMDLLAIKVRDSETVISSYHPEFTGDPRSLCEVQNFICQMFLDTRRNTYSALYYHFVYVVDTEHIQAVFESVRDTIINRNMSALRLY